MLVLSVYDRTSSRIDGLKTAHTANLAWLVGFVDANHVYIILNTTKMSTWYHVDIFNNNGYHHINESTCL